MGPLTGESDSGVAAERDLLATEIRRRLGPPPAPLPDTPLVSIVVVNHDGAHHLRRLVAGLVDRTDYPRFELIVVDNGSTDDSVDFLRAVSAPFPISIVANPHNESFSYANDQGAARATGELLLTLNNDIEPFEDGWLRELVACLRGSGAGAVGATLIYPHDDRQRYPYGYSVQHRGLRFRDEDGLIHPALHDWGADPLDAELGKDVEAPVVVAACMLLERSLYERVGGFTQGYHYGSEDIDFCLKVRAAGERVVCSGRTVLIHHPGSTRRAVVFEDARARKLRNHRLLLESWGPRLRREHDLDGLERNGIWVQAGREPDPANVEAGSVRAPGFCVKVAESGPASIDGGPGGRLADPATDLVTALTRGCHRHLLLRGSDVDDLHGLNYDIAIHVRGAHRYVLKPAQFNVLWVVSHASEVTVAECRPYDLVAATSQSLADGFDRAIPAVEAATPVALLERVTARASEAALPMRIGASTSSRDLDS